MQTILKRASLITTLILAIWLPLFPMVANAISSNDLQNILYGTPFYDPTANCDASTADSTTLIGNDNLQKIFNFFTANGYTPEQAAGIVGNIEVESNGGPEVLEHEEGKITPFEAVKSRGLLDQLIGWGIVQWTPPSKVQDYIDAYGGNANDLLVQLQFLKKQLDGSFAADSEKIAGDALHAVTSGIPGTINPRTNLPYDTAWHAAQVFLTAYERPTDHDPYGPNAQARGKNADDALKLYGAGSQATPTTTGTTTSSDYTPTTQANCSGVFSGDSCSGHPFGGTKKLFLDTNATQYPGVQQMCLRARLMLKTPTTFNQPSYQVTPLFNQWCHRANDRYGRYCIDDTCDGTAGFIWGYPYSGYGDAQAHWLTLRKDYPTRVHPGDRNPPVGALLFYYHYGIPPEDPTNPGHIDVYVGDNNVFSSDFSTYGNWDGHSAGIGPADKIESGLGYLGWADPIFNSTQSKDLFDQNTTDANMDVYLNNDFYCPVDDPEAKGCLIDPST